jgi:hypothetical protein
MVSAPRIFQLSSSDSSAKPQNRGNRTRQIFRFLKPYHVKPRVFSRDRAVRGSAFRETGPRKFRRFKVPKASKSTLRFFGCVGFVGSAIPQGAATLVQGDKSCAVWDTECIFDHLVFLRKIDENFTCFWREVSGSFLLLVSQWFFILISLDVPMYVIRPH